MACTIYNANVIDFLKFNCHIPVLFLTSPRTQNLLKAAETDGPVRIRINTNIVLEWKEVLETRNIYDEEKEGLKTVINALSVENYP